MVLKASREDTNMLNLNRYQIFLFTALIALPIAALSSEVTLPHVFQAGDPALASEVNGNFSAIKSAVDDNNAGIVANDGRITTNANAAADNAAAISANSAAIAGNAANIGGNSSRILDLEQNGFTPPKSPVIGTVTIEGITNPVDLYGLDFSINSATDPTTGVPTGLPLFSPVSLIIDYRADVAGLYLTAVQGQSIPTMTIEILTDKNLGGGRLQIRLANVLIKSLSPDKTQDSGNGPRGSLQLLYSSIELLSDLQGSSYDLATRQAGSTISCRDERIPFALSAPSDPGGPENTPLTSFNFDFYQPGDNYGGVSIAGSTTNTGLKFQTTNFDLLPCLFTEAAASTPLRFQVDVHDSTSGSGKPAFSYLLTPSVLPRFAIKSDNQGGINAEVSLYLQAVAITANQFDNTGAVINTFIYEWSFHTAPI